ncbi:MAG: prephenate dehydrogenase/arogenate dehydrogenase family protein [Planctomycetota bacterium]|jgi:prephenate dehydrogenase|nr:prephenate dehydrogenase/arogenate dehydrogenase family protein [Planctomycetota bacterium]
MTVAAQTLGIIGFGAFGRFMAKHLAPHFTVIAWDRKHILPDAVAGKSVLTSILGEAASADIVVFAVPWDSLKEAATAAAPHLRPGALALDVTSVKSGPAALLPKILPENVDLLCTHPLFGPQSGKNGIAGLRIALCPIRIGRDRYRRVRAFLTGRLYLSTFRTTPDEHDREMAKVQAVTHFMSRALKALGLNPSPLATKAYEKLQEFSSIVLSDSWDLFLTIQNGNPYAANARKRLRREMDKLENQLHDGELTEPLPPPYAAAF